jgi:NADPH-ferrihemoprotein reductase
LFDTLLHCVDLAAIPSPSFSRELLGRKDIDYKKEIANPCRTVLDLALESSNQLSLEDFLYNMPPLQPRYYSIASSPLLHPQEVYLTYRPVKYVSSRGSIREGTCTTYLSNLVQDSQIIGALKSNPAFRLPKDPSAPVLMMAGGCGIAAIRSFLEERLALQQLSNFGECHLFLGFRSPCDEVYRDLVDEALQKGVLSSVQVSYSSGSPTNNLMVSDAVGANGQLVWDLFENGGYTYLCGGARTFGAAMEREVMTIIQKYGNMSEEDAIHYLRQLIKEGRFCEDLAD